MQGKRTNVHALLRAAGIVPGGVIAAATAAIAGLTSYLGVLTVAALRAGGRAGSRSAGVAPPTPLGPQAERTRFVLMIPAHNEASGIGRTITSLRLLDYPKDLFSVHVVADNCIDETAIIVRGYGAFAHERLDPDDPGKGPALNWLFDCLVATDPSFDAVVIIDADTSLEPGFLRAMDSAVRTGATAAQGFYGVRDVGHSSAAALRYAALACRHHLRPLGRTRLGGSSGLYGNGMVFSRELMTGRRWSGHLTEDMEFQMDLLLDGTRVVYVPGAVLEAEMPDTLATATTQNERWELGRIQMARRYVPLLMQSISNGDRRLRAAYVDSMIDHLVPPLSVLAALNGVTTAAAAVQTIVRGHRLDRISLIVSVGSSATICAHVLIGLRSVAASATVYRSLLQAPRMIAWKLGVWLRVLLRPDSVTWTRTIRNAEAPI